MMKNNMKFIKELFSNPDGTGSTKRTVGWILIICAITTGFSGLWFTVNTALFDMIFCGFLTTGAGMFGMSSFDYLNFLKKEKDTKNNI